MLGRCGRGRVGGKRIGAEAALLWELQKRILGASSSCSSRRWAALQTSLFMGAWEVGAAGGRARGRPPPAGGRQRGAPTALNAACVPAAAAAHNEPFQAAGASPAVAGPACEHGQLGVSGLSARGPWGVSVPSYKPGGWGDTSPMPALLPQCCGSLRSWACGVLAVRGVPPQTRVGRRVEGRGFGPGADRESKMVQWRQRGPCEG